MDCRERQKGRLREAATFLDGNTLQKSQYFWRDKYGEFASSEPQVPREEPWKPPNPDDHVPLGSTGLWNCQVPSKNPRLYNSSTKFKTSSEWCHPGHCTSWIYILISQWWRDKENVVYIEGNIIQPWKGSLLGPGRSLWLGLPPSISPVCTGSQNAPCKMRSSPEEGIKKMWYTYTIEYYSDI